MRMTDTVFPIPIRKKSGVHYRKISHGIYVVWVEGTPHVFGGNRAAKRMFKAERSKSIRSMARQ